MNDILATKVGRFMVGKFGKTGLVLQKYSPEILLGVGIVGAVAATVLACKATLKAGDILADAKTDLTDINQVKAEKSEDVYSQKDYQQDLAIVYLQTTVKFAKLYGPAVGLGALSIASILASHGIMNRRNVGLMAAYSVVADGFAQYRDRVVKDLGPDADKKYRFGVTEEEVEDETTDETGKVTKTKKKIKVANTDEMLSEYSRIFDECSANWHRDPTYNMHFLITQQNWFNDMLRIRGHVFLNEVYDALGFDRTPAGAVVGWLKRDKDDPRGDGIIDFDVFNMHNSEAKRDFLTHKNPSIVLDFNVDGPIWNKI